MTDQTNTPELRFPEFKKEWQCNTLDNCCYKISDGIHSTPIYSKSGDFSFINGNNLINGKIHFENAKLVDSKEALKHKRNLTYNETILLSINGTIGNIALYRGEKIILGKSAAYINIKANFLNPLFLYYFLETNSLQRYFRSELTGTTIKNLSIKSIKKTKLYIPNITEQRKIGDFFRKLDQQIELEEKKLELLEQQKRGYMQKLFSQELKFRDKNGNDYPEWQLKNLSELGETFTGLSGKTKDDFGYGDGLFITYMNVFKNTIAKSDMVERVKIEANENQNKVQYGDILFTTSSEVPNEVGMSSIWLFNQDNVYLNSFCFGFRVVVNYIKPVYLARYLRSEEMRKTITILAQGSTRFNISKKEMMKLNIKVPYIEEQIKIDNFFNKIDTLILKQDQKIELLKQRKKGLLQKMFI